MSGDAARMSATHECVRHGRASRLGCLCVLCNCCCAFAETGLLSDLKFRVCGNFGDEYREIQRVFLAHRERPTGIARVRRGFAFRAELRWSDIYSGLYL